MFEAAKKLDGAACKKHGAIVWKSLLNTSWEFDPDFSIPKSERQRITEACFHLEMRLDGEPKGPRRWAPPEFLEKIVALVLNEDTLTFRSLQADLQDECGYEPFQEELAKALKPYCEEVWVEGVTNPSYKVKPGTLFKFEGDEYEWPEEPTSASG